MYCMHVCGGYSESRSHLHHLTVALPVRKMVSADNGFGSDFSIAVGAKQGRAGEDLAVCVGIQRFGVEEG